MLDIKLLRKDPELIRKTIQVKHEKADIDAILVLDQQKREKLIEVENLKSQQNKANKEITKAKLAGEDITKQVEEMSEIVQRIKVLDTEIAEIEPKLNQLLLWLPNIPAEDVPEGTEELNKVIRFWGEKKQKDFTCKPHWELGKNLGIMELERAVKITGTGFTMLRGLGARLERALINFMIDLHVQNGYEEINPPYMVNRKTLIGTSQLPKLEEDMYHNEKDDYFMIPTGEVPVTNFYQDEIIPGEKLPIRFVTVTPCFRREAGTYGKDTRGLLRVHQFQKVELVNFVRPETSYDALEKLLAEAELVLQKLDLPYRIVLLATGDMSFSSAKTYDIELWAPGVEKWLEVSSCSNCTDFQARRAAIRFKDKGGKTQFVHTLNGSGVALPRLLVSIIENYQQADGHIRIPEVLVPYMGGVEVI
jgi:seryl-tRNA synthetase